MRDDLVKEIALGVLFVDVRGVSPTSIASNVRFAISSMARFTMIACNACDMALESVGAAAPTARTEYVCPMHPDRAQGAGSAAMSLSSVSVIANALRPRRLAL